MKIMKKSKRQGFLFLLLLLILCGTGCAKGENSGNEKGKEKQGFGELFIEEITLEQELTQITAVSCAKNRAYFAGSKDGEIWIGSMDFEGKDQEWEQTGIQGTASALATDGKGNFRLLVNSLKIEDGEYKTQLILTEYKKGDGKENGEGKVLKDADTVILDMEKEIVTKDHQKFMVCKNGKKEKELSAAISFAFDVNGDTLALSVTGSTAIEMWNLKTGKKESSFSVDIGGREINHLFLSEDGAYDFYVENSAGIYGCKKDGTGVLLFPWEKGGVVEYYLTCIGGGNGVFFAALDGSGLFRIAEDAKTEEQDDEKEIVVAALERTDTLQNFINDFNGSQDDYHAKIVSYEHYENPEQRLNIDITTGNAPDIISYDPGSIGSVSELLDSLEKKGLLEDLSPYLEADPDLDEDELMETPLKLLKTDGKLTRTAPVFYLYCAVGSRKAVGDRLTWSWDDYERIYREQSEENNIQNFGGAGPFGIWSLSFQCSWKQYVDVSAGEVHFQDGNYTKQIEMLKQMQSLEGTNWGKEEKEFVEDFSLTEGWFYEISYYEYLKKPDSSDSSRAFCEKNDLQLIGMPTDSGTGVAIGFPYEFAVLASSDKKEGAWQLLSSFWKYNTSHFTGLPMIKTDFDYTMVCSMAKENYKIKNKKYYYKTPDGKKEYYDEVFDRMPSGFEITKRQRKNIEDIINLADTVYLPYESKLCEIIRDIDTVKTTQEIAEELESRIGLYVSEKN